MDQLEQWLDKIICGDTVETMRKIPDESVDVVVTSPPYNLRNSTGNGIKSPGGKMWSTPKLEDGYDNHHDNMPHADYVAWQRECLTQMYRLIKPTGAIFYNHKWRVQGGLLQDRQDIVDGFPVRQIIIWQQNGGMNFNSGYFLPTYEVIYMICKPKFKLAPKGNRFGDVWNFNRDGKNFHPAPFPIDLPKRILGATMGNVALDPFMGSGTTAVAAKQLGWHWIGIDNSLAYCDKARERLDATVADLPNETVQNSLGM